METAINAMWDSKPSIGDKTFVIGAGIVGLLMAYVLKNTFGIDVTVIDKDSKKKKLCSAFGITYKKNLDDIKDPDIVYECSGSVDVLDEIINNSPLETKICILSWYGKQQAKISMGENCFSRRLELIFSQVGNITSYKSKKWNNLERRLLALKMLKDDKLDILIDNNELSLSDLPVFFKKGNPKGLCKVVKY
jgi:threonine dehydrogenase-like Zn-dependent dehydrogenase